MNQNRKGRARPLRAAFFSLLVFGGIVGTGLVFHPDTPLPDGWNPIKPLVVSDDLTPLTYWKLSRTANVPAACVAALQEAADIRTAPTFQAANDACRVEAPVDLNRVGLARMSGVQTDCPTALRLAMWEQHGLQPAAQRQLGLDVVSISDIGSYNCRAMRTSSGETGRMSSHATASSIDITGFQFADGRRINLTDDWNDSDDDAAFLRAARDSACEWFPLTLSPDYNALHADHFHLQATGWRLCR